MPATAAGPRNWSTGCSADGAGSTGVQVIVDGVAGNIYYSHKPIGNIIFTNDQVDLGGQGPIANKDSIDGQFESVSYSIG